MECYFDLKVYWKYRKPPNTGTRIRGAGVTLVLQADLADENFQLLTRTARFGFMI